MDMQTLYDISDHLAIGIVLSGIFFFIFITILRILRARLNNKPTNKTPNSQTDNPCVPASILSENADLKKSSNYTDKAVEKKIPQSNFLPKLFDIFLYPFDNSPNYQSKKNNHNRENEEAQPIMSSKRSINIMPKIEGQKSQHNQPDKEDRTPNDNKGIFHKRIITSRKNGKQLNANRTGQARLGSLG